MVVMQLLYNCMGSFRVHKGVQADVDYGYKASSLSGTVLNFFTALGDVAFAYAGHNVVLEIQATIPSMPEKPSKLPMERSGGRLYYSGVVLLPSCSHRILHVQKQS